MKNQRFFRLSQSGGILLPLLMTITASLAGIGGFLYMNYSQMAVSASALSRQSFKTLNQGLLNAFIVTSQQYIREEEEPTSEGLEQYLNLRLSDLVPEPLKITSISAKIIERVESAPLPNGPFKGLLAPQTIAHFSIKTQLESDAGEAYTSRGGLEATVSLGSVSLFQFLFFIDQQWADLSPGPRAEFKGPVHVNGDACLSGGEGFYLDRITSSGRIMFTMDNRCNAITRSPGAEVYIASEPNFEGFKQFRQNIGNNCNNCAGTGLKWRQFALQHWNERVWDLAHGVPHLRVPRPTGIQTNNGAFLISRWGNNLTSNNGRLKYLIEKPRDNDSNAIREQKLALQADIRIVDGEWYLKNPSAPLAWPGIPIWSDHPGSINLMSQDVGQRDLRETWGRWQGPHPPKHFSRYGYNEDLQTIVDSDIGVISYGALKKVPGADRWEPAHWFEGEERHNLCKSMSGNALVGDGQLNQAGGMSLISGSLSCSDGKVVSSATRALNGTRTGFLDPHAYIGAFDVAEFGNILPMNFDLEHFQKALQNKSPGELGSYFGSGGIMGREFNGILFISARRDKQMGHGWPQQDNPSWVSSFRLSIPKTSAKKSERALPWPLCSSQLDRGKPLDKGADGNFSFRIAECASYSTWGAWDRTPGQLATGVNQPMSRIDAIRIYHGKSFNKNLFKNGLSIVSDEPLYILGDYNADSDVTSSDPNNWTAAMVAGDQITLLSNAWSDESRSWQNVPFQSADATTLVELTPPLATSSIYNMAMFQGWARSGWRNGSPPPRVPPHGAHAVMENWKDQTLQSAGSTVIGFHPSKYLFGRFFNRNITYEAPEREITHDPHFTYPAMQPPGTPQFPTFAIIDYFMY